MIDESEKKTPKTKVTYECKHCGKQAQEILFSATEGRMVPCQCKEAFQEYEQLQRAEFERKRKASARGRR